MRVGRTNENLYSPDRNGRIITERNSRHLLHKGRGRRPIPEPQTSVGVLRLLRLPVLASCNYDKYET